MGSKRTLILIAAVLVGALASYSLYTYVNGVEDRAYSDAELVEVYVVTQTVPQNTTAEEAIGNKLVARSRIPQEFRPASAVTDLAVLSGQVAQVQLEPNQVLVSGMFAGASKVYGTFSERLEPGEVAVSVSVDQVRGVGGRLVPGDRVNLMVIVEQAGDQPAAEGEGGAAAGASGPRIQYLYQDTKILAVGQQVDAGSDGGGAEDPSAGLITFAVTPDAAQRIALASTAGQIYMSLVPGEYTPEAIPPVDLERLTEGIPLTPSPVVAGQA